MLALHLGLRWLKRRRAAWLAIAAIALTVAVPVFIVDLTQGWYRLVAINARANEADIVVQPPSAGQGMRDSQLQRDRIAAVPGVAMLTPIVDSWAIMSRTELREDLRGNIPCQTQGIAWGSETAMSRIRPAMLHPQPIMALRAPEIPPTKRGTGFVTRDWRAATALAGLDLAAALGGMPAALPPAPRPRPGIVCGRELLFQQGMWPGEQVLLSVPNGSGGTVGKISAEISDTVGTGALEIDRYAVLAPLPLAQRLAGMGPRNGREPMVSGYRVSCAAGEEPRQVARRISDLAMLNALTWEDLRGNYVKSQEIQRNLAIAAMVAIQAITIFVIYAVFSTMVAELRHDIGVLRGLGARRRDISLAFLSAGVTACLVGGILGWVLGWGALAALNPISSVCGFSLFPESVFYTPDAPTSFDWWIPPLFITSMTGIGLIAVLIPAWRASRVQPIDTLREGA